MAGAETIVKGPPAQTTWAQMPAGHQVPTGCPPGLEYLVAIDQILVHQQIELLEAFTGFETRNKYEVKNSMGQRIFFAGEGICNRLCCGHNRPFEMRVIDNMGQEAMHISRPIRCTSCLCFCCLQKLEVRSKDGQLIGTVEQNCTIFRPKFTVRNGAGEAAVQIVGPLCTCNLCGDIEFSVQAIDGTQIGLISKQWSGLIKEVITDADNFGVAFPMDLSVDVKACLFAAVFLIDYMYFEQNTDDKGRAHHSGIV